MRDVAKRAGVGIKTVSRVVNKEPGVSDDTKAHILCAIADLGFRPNISARDLKQGKTKSLGLVCEDLSEPFQSCLIRAVEEVAIKHGHMLFVASSAGDADREQEAVQALSSRQVGGLIITPARSDPGRLATALPKDSSVVFVDRPAPGLIGDCILADNAGGIHAAVQHLTNHRHRRIAFIGDQPNLFTQTERVDAFRHALQERGLPVDDRMISMQRPDPVTAAATLTDMLNLRDFPTAIITGNALCTFAVLHGLAGQKRRPALIGFDDFAMADLLDPAVTVIAQNAARMGELAAELLFKRLSGAHTGSQTIRLATRLIVRGSGELAP
ncbi:LacI family DNA-binding transcriptional regulator [Faunimonas pinastri]|nr:LacI family DNA-binding transcriptional regulator [Faunimonas pinastri]